MLLFNPSPGQITDRMQILNLKLMAYDKKGWNTISLDKEYLLCQDKLNIELAKLEFEVLQKYDGLARQLFDQNKKQWESEDQLRPALEVFSWYSIDPVPCSKLMNIAVLAERTHKGNENRNRLICAIDALFNLPTEPKVYNE